MIDSPNADSISFEAKLLRQPDGLTAPITEQFGDSAFAHRNPLAVYTDSIYQRRIDDQLFLDRINDLLCLTRPVPTRINPGRFIYKQLCRSIVQSRVDRFARRMRGGRIKRMVTK